MSHSKGSKYSARFKQATAATYFGGFFPKKHIPMLFHNCALLGVCNVLHGVAWVGLG